MKSTKLQGIEPELAQLVTLLPVVVVIPAAASILIIGGVVGVLPGNALPSHKSFIHCRSVAFVLQSNEKSPKTEVTSTLAGLTGAHCAADKS